MFAARSSKTKKNKRKRVADDEEEDAGNRSAGVAAAGEDDDDQLIAPIVSDRRKINTFSTGAGKKAKNVVQVRQIESEREIVPQKYAGDATYETQIDTEKDRDARSIMERNIKRNEDGSADQESGKIYKGQAGYKNYISKNESQIGMNKYTGTQGPIRAQTWARAISRFDYQPDICKDYKETGFCGYGDSCKFLHDRGDYKSGWQIEKEWAEKEKKRQLKLQQGLNPDEDDEDDDDKYVIHSDDEEQFACTICRGPFRNAVETIKQTNGVFNAAEKLRRREQEEKEHEQEDESDGDEHETADKSKAEENETSGGWAVVS
ncbi:Ring finger protein, partial [Globisporangium splendens]